MNFKSHFLMSTDLDQKVKITKLSPSPKDSKPKRKQGKSFRTERQQKLVLRTSEF